MRILVTGGAGFIGSHLCEALINNGHHVVCLDNLSTGTLENIASLKSNPRFSFIEHDVVQEINLDVDRIFNLACPASPVAYQKDPIRTLMTNVAGAHNVLRLAERCGASVIQASTSEVYGDPEIHPQDENYWGKVNPIGVRACYDEGKRAAEALFFDFHRTKNISVKVARIFNTYGPRMNENDGRVVSNFVVQALRGASISIYGDGCQTRSFCFVDDLVRGLICLGESDYSVVGPINLGNPDEVAIIDFADLVMQLLQTTSKIEFRPLPGDDPRKRKPDISRARELLGWEPRIPLHEGLKATISYFSSILANKFVILGSASHTQERNG